MENSVDILSVSLKENVSILSERLGYSSYDFEIVEKFDKGENYLGEIKRGTLLGVKNDGEKEKLNLIIKTIPEQLRGNDVFPLEDVFSNEVFMYNHYLPIMLQLQNEIIDPMDEDADPILKIAKCYLASNEQNNEILIFEDMKNQGYEMYDRFKSFDYEHLMLCARVLAGFHALGFAHKVRTPKNVYEEQLDRIKIPKESGQFDDYMTDVTNQILSFMETEENRTSLKRYLDGGYLKMFRDVMNVDKERPYAIMVHGDFWINNMLFKYEEGKPKSLVLLDWQISKYTTPILDLLYLLYNCTDEEMRDEHWNEVLSTYYTTLKNKLISLNCDPETCFPETAFYEELKKYQEFSMINTMMMLPLILNKKETSLDLKEILDGVTEEKYSNIITYSDLFKKRINGVVRHLAKCNVI